MHPFLIFGDVVVPTYLLVISLVCCLSIFWAHLRAKEQNLETKIALDLSLMIMVGGFLGARLMHVFVEDWQYYKVFPLDAFRFWEGGFVYFGGWIGGFALASATAILYRQPLVKWWDFFAPVLALAYGLGRLACFLNGCCYGELCDLPWAIEFSHPGLPPGARHPTQLYASLWELLITLPTLLFLERRKVRGFVLKTGTVFFTWILLHGLGRLLMEGFCDDPRGNFIFGISPSSWISISFVLIGSLTLYSFYRSRKV